MATETPNSDKAPKPRGRPSGRVRDAILAATAELLREQGVARFTTPEVAKRAGVAEGSIFYHFTDRIGLLQATFMAGLEPLRSMDRPEVDNTDHARALEQIAKGIEQFLDQAMPVLFAAQSDVRLHDALAAYLNEENLGPHRGITLTAAYLAREQQAGRIAADVDTESVAMLLVSSCFLRVGQHQIVGTKHTLPSRKRTIATIVGLLGTPAG
ncbi:hypothetical protein GCM10023205_53730 [Yinghuangia aomiensis]|uniref:HTH tetR-type domain-containing protein n=1 Tax=Yinghuangia aomiensis TaxID=676205 RepID=A0ABP9HV03_9ACTN